MVGNSTEVIEFSLKTNMTMMNKEKETAGDHDSPIDIITSQL